MNEAKLSIYADMSCFLYYKNLLLGSENVMLHHMNNDAITYSENLPYNRTFSYSIFFLSAVLMLIIQQVMFYGTTMLAGTAREENRSFATLPASLHGHGVSRVIFGRVLSTGSSHQRWVTRKRRVTSRHSFICIA